MTLRKPARPARSQAMATVSSFPARCGLAILSGAVYALAYPPLGWGWLVIPGLAGLLVALQGQRGTRARAIGFLHGMSAYGIGLAPVTAMREAGVVRPLSDDFTEGLMKLREDATGG